MAAEEDEQPPSSPDEDGVDFSYPIAASNDEGGGDDGESMAASGEAMHTGYRLSTMRIEQRLSINQPWLEPLHDLKVEFSFHYRKVRERWGIGATITLVVGCLAFLTGASDLGSGELSGGGNVWLVGVDGLQAIEWQAFAMMVTSISLWFLFISRIITQYPIMREKAFYLILGMFAANIGLIVTHAGAPKFPLGADLSSLFGLLGGGLILGFLCFNTWQAVVQTRDLHVETQHGHPDPRRVEAAKRDHSLQAWVLVLIGWALLVLLNSWAAAHSVASRDSSAMFPSVLLYVVSGWLVIWTLLHILWYPQMMLGSSETEIESHRAREVSAKLRGEELSAGGQKGECPVCGGRTAVTRLPTGLLEVACVGDDCHGSGVPGERCTDCSSPLPLRITCEGCGTSAPLSDHLPDLEAW